MYNLNLVKCESSSKEEIALIIILFCIELNGITDQSGLYHEMFKPTHKIFVLVALPINACSGVSAEMRRFVEPWLLAYIKYEYR